MTPRIIDTPPAPGTTEWRRIISASKVPAILGISRFKSQYAMWHEMAGNVDAASVEGEHIDWGHDAELSLAAWWKRHNPQWRLNAIKKGRSEVTYTDPDLPFPNLATLDRRAINLSRKKAEGRYHIVECKTARDIDTWGQPGDPDAIPADYYAQVMFQMGVSGIHEASLVVLGYGTPEIHPVDFDQHLFNGIVDRCQQWWESLEKGAPPPLDDHPTTYETVRGLHPDIDKGTEIQIDHQAAEAFLNTIARADQAEKDARGAKAQVLDHMGSAQKLMCGDIKVADRRTNGHGSVSLYPNKKAQLEVSRKSGLPGRI